MKKTMEYPEDYAQCSVAMAYYLFRALEKTEMYEETNTCWDLWRNMVKDHLTTCVEDGVNGRSDCHAWGSLALFELPAIVLGVHPAAPGYKEIAVSPNMGYFDWAKGEVITKRGIVKVSWEKDSDGNMNLEYRLPE